jgi:hypothetical protein
LSICVCVKVSEGLVLATDSTSTVWGQTAPNAPVGVLKTYDHARKLSHLKDYPIGTMTWGNGFIDDRSIESLIKEFEYGLPSLEADLERLKELQTRKEEKGSTLGVFSVQQIAKDLQQHVELCYTAAFGKLPQQNRPPIGILVAGYSSGNFFPEQWLIDLPGGKEITRVRPDENGKPSFGAHWFGVTDAINRLHHGRDDAALILLAKRFGVTPQEINTLLSPLQYPVAFNGMPLQDAIDYATYLVNVVIGRFRFTVGVPVCGGEVDVAVITPNQFTWVQRKTWKVERV